jgi:NAD(P)-dependent dehydrogenase (short-subunit alcohol dehydrogenase family)
MLTGKTAMVIGASRGLGRGVAEAFDDAGATVWAIARDNTALRALSQAHPSVAVHAADAADPGSAHDLIHRHDPDILAIVAGAAPALQPIQHHTWETFSQTWEVDVRIAFEWLREAMLKPLRPGSRILLMSSGAAVNGSPLSGGYAGAKAAIRLMAAYADEESARAGLGIRVVAVLPKLTPATGLGLAAVRAYAERRGVSEADYREILGPPVTPGSAGQAFVTLAGTGEDGVAYLLTGDGIRKL